MSDRPRPPAAAPARRPTRRRALRLARTSRRAAAGRRLVTAGSPGWGLVHDQAGRHAVRHRGALPHDGGQAGPGEPAAGQRQPDHRRHAPSRSPGPPPAPAAVPVHGTTPRRARRHALAASPAGTAWRRPPSPAPTTCRARTSSCWAPRLVIPGGGQRASRQHQQRRQHLRRAHLLQRGRRRGGAQPGPCWPAATCRRRRGCATSSSAKARANGVDPALALAVSYQESGWNMHVVSVANAVGAMQVIPATSDVDLRRRRPAAGPHSDPRTTPRRAWSCSRSSPARPAASGRRSRATTRACARSGRTGCTPTRGGTSPT